MTNELDNDEVLHLAIRASADGDHEQALRLLKEATQRFPDDHRVLHMLGAEYAEIGMLGRAREALESAIALNGEGDSAVARFQLAMACIMDGDDAAAQPSLNWLGQQASPPLSLYGAALEKLTGQQTDEGLALLRRGLAEDTRGTPLYRDMSRLASQIEDRGGKEEPSQDKPDQRLSAVLAGGYGGDTHS